MVAATEAWSDCIGEEGFDYNNPDEIEEDIQERFDAITEGQDPQTLTGSALEALTELQGEERAVAQIDFECAEELLEPVIEQVEAEIYGAPGPSRPRPIRERAGILDYVPPPACREPQPEAGFSGRAPVPL